MRHNLSSSLQQADLLVIPGGNEDLADTWQRLTVKDQRAVDTFVHQGGKYLGICLGAYLAGDFQSQAERVGWRWLNATEYQGPLQGDVMEALVKTQWQRPAQTRLLYFSEGTSFGRVPPPRAQVLAHYSNGEIAAMIVPVGRGAAGVIGPHPEANEDWYDLEDLGDTDGYDADMLYTFLDALM
ncbi:BPL-N domain-containing protein [Deinococcus sp. Marseille-Q6407]|uniref:BPL-N domain-containing protein n=1 Tax=Deinococcus sp. Marseille-Q6407 TaxID=2969223 RepID=UPI0021C16F51|nr:BPL-N domain-containing protein [Deinococcus sp. Marseille-Q6407]